MCNYVLYRVAILGQPWREIYEYVFDRLRAVRQDLVMQDCSDERAVDVLEKAVRFYIYSDYRL